MPSRGLYIEEHNRDTLLRLGEAINKTSGQLETEGGVSKYGLSRLEDHSVYVHGFSKIRVLGGALKMPSRGLYIKEHNRGIF